MLFTSLTVYSKLLQLLVSLDVTAESIFHLLYSSSLRRLLVALQPLTSLHGSAQGPLPLLVPPLRSPRRLGLASSTPVVQASAPRSDPEVQSSPPPQAATSVYYGPVCPTQPAGIKQFGRDAHRIPGTPEAAHQQHRADTAEQSRLFAQVSAPSDSFSSSLVRPY